MGDKKDNENRGDGNLSYNEYMLHLTPGIKIYFIFEKISSNHNVYTMKLSIRDFTGLINNTISLGESLLPSDIDRMISILSKARNKMSES